MKEAFIAKGFSPVSLGMIRIANQILDEYRAQNFRLSLRQLYYQLVARDHIPNNQRSYKDLWGDMAESERQMRADLLDYAYKYRSNGNGKEE